jgi:hypothetical protein
MVAMRTARWHGSRKRWHVVRRWRVSEDASHGTSNAATVPRAGNISSDTRAGASGRSRA